MKTSTARQQPDGSIQFSYWEYELLSFQLTEKYSAVFGSDSGTAERLLDAIGLAKVTTHYRQRAKGSVTTTATREPTTKNELVGLFLDDNGEWVIANDRAFFLGICDANATDDDVWQIAKHYLQGQQQNDSDE